MPIGFAMNAGFCCIYGKGGDFLRRGGLRIAMRPPAAFRSRGCRMLWRTGGTWLPRGSIPRFGPRACRACDAN
jgi:hypothetical protein